MPRWRPLAGATAAAEQHVVGIEVGDPALVGQAHLFLEERVEHDGRAPGIFETFDQIQLMAER